MCSGITTRRRPHAEDSRRRTYEACAQGRRRGRDLPHEDVVSSRRLLPVHPDRDDRQRSIPSTRSPLDLYGDVIGIVGSNRDWLRQIDALPRLLGRPTVQRCMRAMLVVPGAVAIETTLQRGHADGISQRAGPLQGTVAKGFDTARYARGLRRAVVGAQEIVTLP